MGAPLRIPVNTASKYMKKKLTEFKGETDNSTKTAGDFTTSFLTTHRTIREKSADTRDRNNTTHQLSVTAKLPHQHSTHRLQRPFHVNMKRCPEC